VVDPFDHLHGLPVAVVNQDRTATIGAQRINIGQEVQRGLSDSPAFSGRLGLSGHHSLGAIAAKTGIPKTSLHRYLTRQPAATEP
jgi:hypothetical protein